MKKLLLLSSIAAAAIAGIVILGTGCKPKVAEASTAVMTSDQMVEHGKYLVMVGGCNDCHSPKIMTQMGPVVDTNNLLSGSPDGMHLAYIDSNSITPGKWYLSSADLTGWVGPWGISYSANLTPDSTTGIGGWTDEMFIKVIRSGKYMGIESGRPIMPPMPWEAVAKMTDQDLKCIYAYLRSIKPVKNRVHDYVPPQGVMAMNIAK
jgi:hypothetical protein